jgi:hypothetical protein
LLDSPTAEILRFALGRPVQGFAQNDSLEVFFRSLLVIDAIFFTARAAFEYTTVATRIETALTRAVMMKIINLASTDDRVGTVPARPGGHS